MVSKNTERCIVRNDPSHDLIAAASALDTTDHHPALLHNKGKNTTKARKSTLCASRFLVFLRKRNRFLEMIHYATRAVFLICILITTSLHKTESHFSKSNFMSKQKLQTKMKCLWHVWKKTFVKEILDCLSVYRTVVSLQQAWTLKVAISMQLPQVLCLPHPGAFNE